MKNSKKILALVLALAMVLCFAACGDKEKEKEKEQGSETTGFDYSAGLDEHGYFDGLKATDIITLGNIDKLVVKQTEVDEQIDEILNTKAYMKSEENKTRTIVNGDTVNIDYVGSINGVEFDGGNTQGNGTEVTIGVTNYIDGFLDQLIGHKPGDEFDINVTFPENYGVDELNGKPAVFRTKVNSVIVYTKNELTDAFVAEFFEESSGWKTVDDLKKGIAHGLAVNDVFDEAEVDMDKIPDALGDQYVARMMFEVEQMALQYQVDVDTYVSYAYASYGIQSADTLRSVYENYKKAAVSEALVYQAIAEVKGIVPTDADLKAYYDQYGITNASDIEDMFGKPYILSTVMMEKVEDYLGSVVVVE